MKPLLLTAAVMTVFLSACGKEPAKPAAPEVPATAVAPAPAAAPAPAGELSKEEAQLAIEHFWAGALRRAVIDGDVENGSVMAGQSVGMVTAEQTIPDIIAELVDQAVTALLTRHRG